MRHQRVLHRVSITAILLLATALPGFAKTVYVAPGGNNGNDGLSWGAAKASVQAGLNAAVDGDEVWVAAGTYLERITLTAGVALYGGFAGTETTLGERDWNLNETTLNGSFGGSVVTSPPGATATTLIDGFTIRRGHSNEGAINCSNASPVITNNKITESAGGVYFLNSTGTFEQNKVLGIAGRGVVCVNGSPLIAHNFIGDGLDSTGVDGGIFCDNSAPTIQYNRIENHYGSGITCSNACAAVITHNIITGNKAPGLTGGGINCQSGSNPKIIGNQIISNGAGSGGGIYCAGPAWITNNNIKANSAGDGGGIMCYNSTAVIANNTIHANASEICGGISSLDSSPMIVNNTVTANFGGSGSAAGIHLKGGSPTIANTIIAFNSWGVGIFPGTTATVRTNCVYGNWFGNYLITDLTGTDGNISVDPLLTSSQYGNLHLDPISPCRDTGDDSFIQPSWTDIDDQSRIQGAHVDIGADESDGTTSPAGPYIIVRVAPDGDDAHDGASWLFAKRTIQAGIDSAAPLGGEVWVKDGLYLERIKLAAYTSVYGGFTGTEAARQERNWRPRRTILDGQKSSPVVTASYLGHATSTLDGFTIRNGVTYLGSWPYPLGGGIQCEWSSPTFAHNLITANTARAGGGIVCHYASPFILDNEIVGNSASGGDSREGGGGIHCGTNAAPLIQNNIIRSNSAQYGAGIHSNLGSPYVISNLILANYSPTSSQGDGIYYYTSFSGRISNNTIIANSGAGIQHQAIFIGGEFRKISNNIVAFNAVGIAGSGANRRYNCVFGNTSYDYLFSTSQTGINGNISADPMFVETPGPGPDAVWGTGDDVFGDVRLLPGSPCIDAGDNAEVYADVADLDGDGDTSEPIPFDFTGGARFFDDPATVDTGAGTPPIVDIGAYEAQPRDCNENSVDDLFEPDGDGNGIIDACDISRLVLAASRKTHGGAGDFDIPLPLEGNAVEPRRHAGTSPGPTLMMLRFSEPVYGTGGGEVTCANIQLSAGICQSVTGSGTGTLAVGLAGIPQNLCLNIAMNDLFDADDQPLVGDNDVNVRVVPGDVESSGVVNITDLNLVKTVLFRPVTTTHFRRDVNADGVFSIVDLNDVKSNLFGTASCP